ncbi:hypothetical protein QUF90_04800 [Desulfococcaceae bacterium HSG9]|nr:hypothetical protein [Desulfococcaceae bacterium HSG9]
MATARIRVCGLNDSIGSWQLTHNLVPTLCVGIQHGRFAPGATHLTMYDELGNYPRHQYETITPAIFMPIEMQLSDGLGVE